jgi:hypothetical protein
LSLALSGSCDEISRHSNGTSVRIYCLLGNLRNAIRPGNSA